MTASSPTEGGNRPEAGAWPLYRAMVGVGLVCGFLIVVVFETTRPVIARNRAFALEQAILRVLPDATRYVSFRLADDGVFQRLDEATAGPGSDGLVHVGYDRADNTVGVALEASGMGYQDTIAVLYGYAFELDAIVGFEVLESRETPGLGDRIGSDPAFLSRFARLDVSLDAQGLAPRHPIEAMPQGTATEPWQIDAISGATISSQAVAEILSRSTQIWIPLVERRIGDFVAVGGSRP